MAGDRDLALLRERYESQYVTTASPEMCVVMLYERLVADLTSADQLFGEFEIAFADLAHTSKPADFKPTLDLVNHAQLIISLLQSSLRPEFWSGADGLAAIYDWLHRQLTEAATRQNRRALQECLPIVCQLADAWRKAAETVITAKSEETARDYALAESRAHIADFVA